LKNRAEKARYTRRSIIVGLGAGVAGSAGGAAPLFAAALSAPSAPRVPDLGKGDMAAWAAHVGERFAVAGGGGLRLAAVEPLCSGGPTPSRTQCFAAVFETAGGGAPAGDSTYMLAPASGPAVPLYLGISARDGRKTRLVAVFN
jgi:hypothetical protein